MPPRKRKTEESVATPPPPAESEEEGLAPGASAAEVESQVDRVEERGTLAEVKRLFRLRQSLRRVDWTSADGVRLQEKLLSLLLNKILYKNAEGQSVAGHVLVMSAATVAQSVAVLKQFIAETDNVQLLTGAGAALHKAWQLSGGAERIQLEEALRSLMKLAVTCSLDVAERLRTVLEPINSDRTDKELCGTVARLYAPVLWRHFNVANFKVRFNAITLFTAVFPLVPQGASTVAIQAEISKQLLKLQEALTDNDHTVRRAAVLATTTLLNKSYAVLSSEWIARLLTTLCEHCAVDCEVSVRLATFENLCNVMRDNPLTQPAIKAVLPKLKLSLHDPSARVRVSFLRLYGECARTLTDFALEELASLDDLFGRIIFERMLLDAGVCKSQGERVCGMLADILIAATVDCAQLHQQMKHIDLLLTKSVVGCLTMLRYSSSANGLSHFKAKLSFALLDAVTSRPCPDHRLNRARLLAVSEMLESIKSCVLHNPKTDVDQTVKTFFYKQITPAFFLQHLGGPLNLDSELLECLAPLQYRSPHSLFEQICPLVDTHLSALSRLAHSWNLLDPYLDTQLEHLAKLTARGDVSVKQNVVKMSVLLKTLSGILAVAPQDAVDRIATVAESVVGRLLTRSSNPPSGLSLEVLEFCLTALGMSSAHQTTAAFGDTLDALDCVPWSILTLTVWAMARGVGRSCESLVAASFARILQQPGTNLSVSTVQEALSLLVHSELAVGITVACLAVYLEQLTHMPLFETLLREPDVKRRVAKLARKIGNCDDFRVLAAAQPDHMLVKQLLVGQ